jgi:fimbrial chaperone protein
MLRFTRRTELVRLATLVAFVTQATLAWGGAFQVYPIRVLLSPGESSTLMTIKNDGADKLRLQVGVTSWEQNSQGEMILKPTDEIVFYPTLLTIDAGEQRNLRVGTNTKEVTREKSYRIFVEELPPNEKLQSSGVRFLTKVSIPIFFQPKKAEVKSIIDKATVRNSEISFDLKNEGNVHIQPKEIRITGSSADGSVRMEKKIPGWYVLAGGMREYRVDLPKADCGKLKDLKIQFEINDKPINETVAMPASGCAK